jgi:hypothetical protein
VATDAYSTIANRADSAFGMAGMVGASRLDITFCDQCHRGASASLTWLIS